MLRSTHRAPYDILHWFCLKKTSRLCSRAHWTNVELFVPILFRSAWMCVLATHFHVGLPFFLPGKAETWPTYSNNVAESWNCQEKAYLEIEKKEKQTQKKPKSKKRKKKSFSIKSAFLSNSISLSALPSRVGLSSHPFPATHQLPFDQEIHVENLFSPFWEEHPVVEIWALLGLSLLPLSPLLINKVAFNILELQ